MKNAWIPRLALAGTTLVAGLALLEVLVRLFDIGPTIMPVHREMFRLSDNPRLRYELLPGATSGVYAINAAGLRDRDRPQAKPAGVFRIACLGDSICMGYHVNPEQTVAGRLEELLNRGAGSTQRTFEVLNFGVTGYGCDQVATCLKDKALAFQPDLVLYLYCLNDPQPYSLEMAGLLAGMTAAQRNYRQQAAGRCGAWLARSRLFLLLRYLVQSRTAEGRRREALPQWRTDDPQQVALRSGRHVDFFRQLHEDPATWEPAAVALDDLARTAREQQVPVVVAIFPVLKDLDAYPLQDLHARLAADFQARGFTAVDLAPPLCALDQLQSIRLDPDDYLHPTPAALSKAAETILARLAQSGLVPGLEPAPP